MRLRWTLFFAAIVTAGCCYSLVFVQHMDWLPVWLGQPNTMALGDLSEALYLLSATLLFSGASRMIASVDVTQALLFAVQRFSLTYVLHSQTHFAANHLLIAQTVSLFLFAAAAVASLGAISRTELRFLRLLTWFLALRLVGMVCSDQVSYVWLHYLRGSNWDVVHVLLTGAFAIFLVEEFRQPRVALQTFVPVREPGMTTRNLMPSLLAVANVALALWMMKRSVTLAALAMALSAALYVARTVLLQCQMDRESALLMRRNRQLETLATRDALTGTGNRRSLESVYGRLPSGSACSLLLLDIDLFKEANDRFGHVHGDRVLVSVADVLRMIESSVPCSHCARFGGDEFALLLPRIGAPEGLRIAEAIRESVAATRESVSVSIGVGFAADATGTELEVLLGEADEALYRAKVSGRNRVELEGVAMELRKAG
jgi:diguanylate cyclase (GGDEF)-like protein